MGIKIHHGSVDILLLVTLVFCGSINKGSSLQCYECTKSEANSCGINFNAKNVSITNCTQSIYTYNSDMLLLNGSLLNNKNTYICLMIKETDTNNSSNMTFTRRCGVKHSNDTCEQIIQTYQNSNIRTECEQCEKDLCNLATNLFVWNLKFGFLLFTILQMF